MQPVAEHNDYKLLYEQQKATNQELQFQISALTLQLEKFMKMVFGSKNEPFVATDDQKTTLQLKLDLDAQTIAGCKITDALKVEYIRTKTEVTPNPPKYIRVV